MSRSRRRPRITTAESAFRSETGQRCGALRSLLRDRGADGFLSLSPPALRYLTGFSGSSGLVLVLPQRVWLITDGRYAVQCRKEAAGARCAVARGTLLEEVARRGLLRGLRRLAFEADEVTVDTHRLMVRAFQRTRLVPTRGLAAGVMEVKSAREVALIRSACALSERVFGEVLQFLKPGQTELEIAGRISLLHRRYGAEADAFGPIVASGPHGAFPHARPTARRIRSGELVTVDLGCVVGGYHSDITRTIAVGRAPRRMREIYRAVREAHDAAVDAARGGLEGRALDTVARRVLSGHGFGRRFPHALGHGLGLRVHEPPRISPRSTDRLRAGSVITIEPGVYVPGLGGVRLESDVLLDEQGCTILTTPPEDLPAV